jgi:hypothetical protein
MATARWWWAALGLVAGTWSGMGLAGGIEGEAALREVATEGRALRVEAVMVAEGTRPDFKDGAGGKPLPFRVETRFEYLERVREVGRDGVPARVVRRAERAEATIGAFRAEGQTLAAKLRPEVSLLVAERKGGSVMTVSVGGPLLRSELDLVQGPADGLMLAEVLPVGDASKGQTWKVPDDVAKGLTEYDALGSNRSESRKKGPVESAIEARSRVRVDRRPIDVPPELSDSALAGLPLDGDEGPRDLILLVPPGGQYTLLHDRDWHLALDDMRQVVLKRLDHGELVAQCDLVIGPKAGKGRHQDLDQFRDDVQRALGKNFAAIAGSGEVGGYRYKLAVEGQPQEGGHPLWYYYLVAGDEGDQLLAVFSLTRELAERFGDQDLRMIGSLEWKDAGSRGD